jgi:hypothetical protein
MPKDLSLLLRETIDCELPHLQNLTQFEAPKPGGWSRKEELGHLIDSATNNHMRFVRATLDGEFRGPGYMQDDWVAAHGYQDLAWSDLIDLWYRYNALLAHLVERIPEAHMSNRCVVGSGDVTLRFLIEDYVLHMQHHLNHILARDPLTPYPSVI